MEQVALVKREKEEKVLSHAASVSTLTGHLIRELLLDFHGLKEDSGDPLATKRRLEQANAINGLLRTAVGAKLRFQGDPVLTDVL